MKRDGQARAISYRGGHLQIIACAGSGKTETVARRVAGLLADGVNPQAIVAFTFTERAGSELKARIELQVAQQMGNAYLDRLNPMFVGTIHSFCLRLLQEHVPYYGAFDILDEHRLVGLVNREYRRLGLDNLNGGSYWRNIHLFIGNMDVVENEMIPISSLGDTAFRACYEEFCQGMSRYRLLTYGQIITQAIRELSNPEIFKRVHENLRHLIVDEYQDINPAQEGLIRLLSQPPVHLCVVGDDDQSIYQWRGSIVENILSFAQRYQPVHQENLPANRRSRPEIIEVANSFAETIQPRLSKKMEHFRDPSGHQEVVCWLAGNVQREAEVIADTILASRELGYRFADIAILLRSVRTSSGPMVGALRSRNIPFRCSGRTGLFLQPEAQLLGKTCAWLVDRTWREGRWEQEYDVYTEDLVDEYVSLFELGQADTASLEHYLERWYEEVHTPTAPANLVRDLYQLLRILSVHRWDLDDVVQAARMGALARFSQLLADFESFTRRARRVPDQGEEMVGGQDRGAWFYVRLYYYLQYYALEAYEDFPGEEQFDLDAVDMLTVHQAKGLEWPVVFVPCLTAERFPPKRMGQAREWLVPLSAACKKRYEGTQTDERRLLYVAITRARDIVYLSTFERINRRVSPSQFLIEIAGGSPPLRDELPLPAPYQPVVRTDEEKPALTFSDIAQYEACPASYRLRASLGFQPPLAQDLGYGKAVHHVLRRIADYTKTYNRLPAEEQVNAIFDQEFYIPFANRPGYEQMKRAAEHLVSKYLSSYSDDLLRVWETERPFELHLEAATVTGRADVILDKEGGSVGSMSLLDYKTAADIAASDIYAFQLAVYAAAGRGEGIDVRAAYIHDLSQSVRHNVEVGAPETEVAKRRAAKLTDGIRGRHFPYNSGNHCAGCDVRCLCRHVPKSTL